MLLPLLVGIVSTFIFSYLAIAWLLRFLQNRNTWIFVWYRLAFGGHYCSQQQQIYSETLKDLHD
jgi:undecaprenyl pyrophosphate phosphatase UppP